MDIQLLEKTKNHRPTLFDKIIHFDYYGIMNEYGAGVESDGISFRCHLEPPNFTVTVAHPDGRVLVESWCWAFEPRYGLDVIDASKMEEVTDRLIKQLRAEQ